MRHAPLGLATALALFTCFGSQTMAKTTLLYIATQNPEKMGITVATFDHLTGSLSAPKYVIEARDPAHLTLSADKKRLYLCNTGTPGGVSAFAVEDRKTGALKLLNYKESKGRGPSYVSVDQSGRYVLDANYGGGFVEVYSLAADGSLDQMTSLVQFEGSSVHPQRQNKPYAHWFRTDPTNKFGLVADLGTDRVMVFKFDEKTGKITPNETPFAKVNGGSGPRHMAFHPNGKWLYAVQELSNEVVALNWDARKGELNQFQAVKTLPADFTEANTAAEIAVRNDGRFLYVSNRGHDSLVVYSIDARSGELTLKQRVPSRGKTPRFFTFDQTNSWLIVSNQEGGNVAVFAVDPRSGELTPKGDPVALPRPMALAFLR